MKRWKKFIKACPLAVCLLCSWGVVAASEHLPELRAQIRQDDPVSANRQPDVSQEALIRGDLLQASDDEAQKGNDKNTDEGVDEKIDQDVNQDMDQNAENNEKTNTTAEQPSDDSRSDGEPLQEQAAKPEKIKPKYLTYEKTKTDSPWYTDPGKIPLTTDYPYEKVKKSYFDDAVFIGDSRIVGMNDYSGLTNATFFAKTGLTVYNLLDEKFVKDPKTGKEVTVGDMMQNYKYGKIYLMVGINELGTGGTQRFHDAYKEVLKKLRKWQPDAVIYVQSIMGVSPKKDRTDAVFNNTNIRDKNCAIAKLTDGIHIFYLNIQELYEDENHALSQDLTFDDVHIYAQYYDRWVKYLKTHAVVKGE